MGAEVGSERLTANDQQRVHDHPRQQENEQDGAEVPAQPEALHAPRPSRNNTRSIATRTAPPTRAAPCSANTSNVTPLSPRTVK